MRRLLPLSIPLLAVVALALAGAATGQDAPPVEPVEPYVEGDLTPDEIGPTSAVLDLTTTIDLACVAVYGTDRSFGQLALDQQMGAAAHRSHRVVLSGLEPDTAYVYRFQGSAPDGRLFASQVYTFRTAARVDDARFGPPVADLRAVDASSTFSEAFAPANAVDGDGGSEWSSAGDGDDAWIELGLPGPTELSGIGVWTRTMTSSARIQRFTIVTGEGETFGPFELPDANGLHRFPVEATAERLTLEVEASTGGNTGLVEVEVYRAR